MNADPYLVVQVLLTDDEQELLLKNVIEFLNPHLDGATHARRTKWRA